ncbi:MAG: hypothetical protein M3Z09_16975, partial [Acidobacteriota bacterium]|nr:hypothetical protein [Acidobacteriota bacterium]
TRKPAPMRPFAIAAVLAIAGVALWLAQRTGTAPASPKPTETPVATAAPAAPAPIPSAAPLALLARYDPPKYQDSALRGDSTSAEAAFRAAMPSYARLNYASAARALRQVTVAYPDYAPAHFFRGACELLLRRPDRAIPEMAAVLRLSDPVFSEEAQWALAKAWLLKGDRVKARSYLDTVVRNRGGLAGPAKQLRSQLLP